jgi:3-methyladenine DNA glycosylase AlkD
VSELAAHADATTKATQLRLGAVEPLFGVEEGDLKPIAKKLRGQQSLALKLFATKNSDALYLAGLIADASQMTKKQLNEWANSATWHMIAGYSVTWVASEHADALELACRWIDSKKELVAIAGWSTLSALAATVPDDSLSMPAWQELLDRCVQQVAVALNRVR